MGTRNGGLEEVVEDGVCGRLLPVGAVDAMSEAATQILSDSELHRKMGRAGRSIAEEKFSVERIVAMYERLYGEV